MDALFDVPAEPRPLTDRQTWIYALIVAAGHEGLTADELGAAMHERYGKHAAGERCAFCGSDGVRAVREAAIQERVVKRGRSGWAAAESRGPSSQLVDLPGESFEDMFGDAAA